MTTETDLKYRLGWVFAWSCLTNAADPGLIKDWGNVLGGTGTALAAMISGWNLIIGVPAAAVRPWSWYVLLGCLAFGPVWGAVYMTLIAPDWRSGAVGGVGALTVSFLSLVYFYRRRVLFRAKWRCFTLERWWPRLCGPEMFSPDTPRGFVGLSTFRRALFITATLVWGALRPLSSL